MMRKLKEWFNRKAKKFVNKHVVIPINMSVIEYHGEVLSAQQRRLNKVVSWQDSLSLELASLKGYLFGKNDIDNRGSAVHVAGLFEVIESQNARINELTKSLEQLEGLAKILPKFDELATKIEMIDRHRTLDTATREVSGRVGKLEHDVNDISTKIRESILKEIGRGVNDEPRT